MTEHRLDPERDLVLERVRRFLRRVLVRLGLRPRGLVDRLLLGLLVVVEDLAVQAALASVRDVFVDVGDEA